MKKIRLEPDGDRLYKRQGEDQHGNLLGAATSAEIRVFEPEKRPEKSGKIVDGVALAKPVSEKHVILITDHPANYRRDEKGHWPDRLQAHTTGFVDSTMSKLEKLKPDVFTINIDGKHVRNMQAVDVIVHTPENVRGHNEEKFERVTYVYEGGRFCQSATPPKELTRKQVAEQLGLETLLENRRAYPIHDVELPPGGGGPGGAPPDPGGRDFAKQSFPNRNLHRAQPQQGVDQEL